MQMMGFGSGAVFVSARSSDRHFGSRAGQASARTQRLRSNEARRRIVDKAIAPGGSVAAVTLKRDVNANSAFGWIRPHMCDLPERFREPPALLPVKVAMPTLLPDRASREVLAVGYS